MNKLKYIAISFLLLLTTALSVPYIFPLTDTASFTGNYRIPYSMGENYFLYNRYSKEIAKEKTIPVIGDSVIWGHYTDKDNTLSANLNRLNAKIKFSNMGMDGIHPAAMSGLMDIYTAKFRNRKIIVGINLLWMSSPRHDLSGPVNNEINHKPLLPQFHPEIPSYKPSFEEKITALISRSIPIFSWIDHVRLTRFAGKSFYIWTMENPHENIMEYFSHIEDVSKVPDGMQPDKMQEQNIEWITAEKSLQWKFMMGTLLALKKNGNEVAAVITPFNTYMMTEESRKKYFSILAEMEWILRENGITPVIPPVLPKIYFADSSHPTAGGYKLIAEDLMKNREFVEFIKPVISKKQQQ
jgi:hypothetical protein